MKWISCFIEAPMKRSHEENVCVKATVEHKTSRGLQQFFETVKWQKKVSCPDHSSVSPNPLLHGHRGIGRWWKWKYSPLPLLHGGDAPPIRQAKQTTWEKAPERTGRNPYNLLDPRKGYRQREVPTFWAFRTTENRVFLSAWYRRQRNPCSDWPCRWTQVDGRCCCFHWHGSGYVTINGQTRYVWYRFLKK